MNVQITWYVREKERKKGREFWEGSDMLKREGSWGRMFQAGNSMCKGPEVRADCNSEEASEE
jgi:hypothetical protein